MQNLKLFNTNILTMTLKEITDLLEVQHSKAMIKVTKMLESESFGTVSKVDFVYNDRGQTIETYVLDRRQSLAVAARLNTELLFRVIDRWQELEQERTNPYFNTSKKELLKLALEQEEKIEYLEQFKETVNNSKVIFPKKESVFDQERGFKQDVKYVYPFLSNAHISLILDYYTTKKYRDTDHYIKSELDCVSTFFTEAEMNISASKDTVVVTHPCLLTNTLRIRKDKAIKYLDYNEEQFK